jgi:hypothetical protein
MSTKITFFPLGNADCFRIDLANGRKLLIDYADKRDREDPYDKRVDLPDELRRDLGDAGRDYLDVVCFTHLDDDHVKGSSEFFWLRHAVCYQDKGRIKINELWVPAAAVTEEGAEDDARVIRQEARHRLQGVLAPRPAQGPSRVLGTHAAGPGILHRRRRPGRTWVQQGRRPGGVLCALPVRLAGQRA